MMDAKALKEITSELSLLYVEDDESLREETSKLFGHLFNKVETAENGKAGLEKLAQTDFDLIITDINMPIMDGLQFSREIRKKNNKQTIIITSAHDESNYLLELIDTGIDKFILKPLDMGKLISTLTQVCNHILNEKLIESYKKELEASNIKLKESNKELELLIKVLDKKIEQLNNKNSPVKKTAPTPPSNAINKVSSTPPTPKNPIPSLQANSEGLYIYKDYLLQKDLSRLNKLERDIDAMSVLLGLQNNIEEASIISLGEMFSHYGKILNTYPVFKGLGKEIINLGRALEENASAYIEQLDDISILLESFLYVLRKWHKALFIKGIKDPNIYDTSMINDIETIILMLRQEDESFQKDLEFF